MKTSKLKYIILLLILFPFISFGQGNNNTLQNQTDNDKKVKAILDSIQNSGKEKPVQQDIPDNNQNTQVQDTGGQVIDTAAQQKIDEMRGLNPSSGRAAKIDRLKNEDKMRKENEKRLSEMEKAEIEQRKEFLRNEEKRKKEDLKQRKQAEKEEEKQRIENAKKIEQEIKENRKRLEDME